MDDHRGLTQGRRLSRHRRAPLDPKALKEFVDTALTEALERLDRSAQERGGGTDSSVLRKAPRSHPAKPNASEPPSDEGESGDR